MEQLTTPPSRPCCPVLIPSTYTSTHAPESFTIPNWGNTTWHTLFSNPQTPTQDLSAGVAVCPPHTGQLSLHRHAQSEIYYFLSGRGIVMVDGVAHGVEKGSAVFIPGDAEHGVKNEGAEELKWFYVFPLGSFGEVVYRFEGEGWRTVVPAKL